MVKQFNAQGTPIDILQIGNEINGLHPLHPAARAPLTRTLQGLIVAGGQHIVRLVRSVAAAALGAQRRPRRRLYGQCDDSPRGRVGRERAEWVVREHPGAGRFHARRFRHHGRLLLCAPPPSPFPLLTPSDPFYGTSATLANLQTSLNNLANTYGKPIIVAETDWPATNACGSTMLSENYALSPDGQTQWLQAIVNVLKAVPNGLGQGYAPALRERSTAC